MLAGRKRRQDAARSLPTANPWLVAGRQLAALLLPGLASNDKAAPKVLGSKLLTEMIRLQ